MYINSEDKLMKENREALESYIQKIIYKSLTFDKTKSEEFIDRVHEIHNLSIGRISDYISGRAALQSATEFELFCLLQGLIHLNLAPAKQLSYYFTLEEIKDFEHYRLEDSKDIFPIIIKAVEISDGQWIGATSVKELMQLRAHSLINYNVNAQRTMQRVIKGDKELYRITLNKHAVNSIRRSFESGEFIPNTITLNIPEDPENEFYYNEKNSELVIKNINHFDISDGYHRYVAACQAYDQNDKFNYPLEIRIVSFDNDKVKKFIFQEDQKTKMSVINRNSLDTSRISNAVTEKLNNSMMSNLKGLILRDSPNYNYITVSYLIDFYFSKNFNRVNSTEKNRYTMELSSKLMKDFNAVLDSEPSLLNQGTWGNIAVMLQGFQLYDKEPSSDDNQRNMVQSILVALKKAKALNLKPDSQNRMKRKTANEIRKLFIDS